MSAATTQPPTSPGPATRLLTLLSTRQELVLVGLLVLTMAMMILPMPTALADVLIATNIGLSTLLMMVAIYIRAPVEFSTLPSVILITTAFRLSISITTSRMVLVQADAGEIIRTFGDFVIAGNVVVGAEHSKTHRQQRIRRTHPPATTPRSLPLCCVLVKLTGDSQLQKYPGDVRNGIGRLTGSWTNSRQRYRSGRRRAGRQLR